MLSETWYPKSKNEFRLHIHERSVEQIFVFSITSHRNYMNQKFMLSKRLVQLSTESYSIFGLITELLFAAIMFTSLRNRGKTIQNNSFSYTRQPKVFYFRPNLYLYSQSRLLKCVSCFRLSSDRVTVFSYPLYHVLIEGKFP